jgi:non-specific serine/threonine protein kinase/serine/threonine-protein kinase
MVENSWREVEQAFSEVFELPEEQRQTYLDRPDLAPEARERTRELLQAWHQSEGFLEQPALILRHDTADHRIGESFGPWRLVSVIGSGGMGTVYRGERDDHQFKQIAAVKVVSVGRVTPSAERRFREERQILARLEHPGVARLIDGGVSKDGSPYLVMELISGTRIDRWARDRSLKPEERLRLFRQVCDAVQFAHQNLVVHCDLKPANILVTPEGAPKLLDFGIARVISEGQTSAGTVTVAMTPDYASPEQVRGAPLTTATDIYSLGVVLHLLLTGRAPYRLQGMTLDQLLATVCDREIDAPRTGSTDLDSIILKALRKDPAERYGSAAELSADIGRYLDGLPVDARPPRAAYVMRKFVARHRLGVAAAAMVALLLVTAGAAIVWESRIASRRFNDVRELAHFVLFDMDKAIEPLGGSTPIRKSLISHGLQYLDGLAKDASGDPNLQREIGEAYLRIGDVSGLPSEPNLGDTPGALRSYQRAVDELEPLFRKNPRDAEAGKALGSAYQHLGIVYSADRRGEDAMRAADKLLAVQQKLAETQTGDPARQGLAVAYSTRASAAMALGRNDQFLRDYTAATQIFEELLAKDPTNPNRQRNAALGHKYIAGQIRTQRTDPSEIRFHLHRAEELDEARVKADPSNRTAKLDLSFDYSQDGDFQEDQKDWTAARDSYLKVLAIREDLARSDPADVLLRDRLVYIHNMLASVFLTLKYPDAARIHSTAAIVLSADLYSRNASPENRHQLALSSEHFGDVEKATGHRARACDAWKRSVSLLLENQRLGKGSKDEKAHLDSLTAELSSCAK